MKARNSIIRSRARTVSRTPKAILGGALTLAFVLVAAVGPAFAPYRYDEMDILNATIPPSGGHVLGTDAYGRDLLSRLLVGSRVSLAVGVTGTLISLALGLVLGLTAGYYPGLVDEAIMRVVDILLAFPGLLLALAVVVVLGPSLVNTAIAVGIGTAPFFARVIRGAVISVRENEYVVSARALGASDARIVLRHILPNILPQILVISSIRLGSSILTTASLGFLGLGVQPPLPEWGAMQAEARDFVRDAWWLVTFPGIAISLAVLGVNLVGDVVQDVLDPRLRLTGGSESISGGR